MPTIDLNAHAATLGDVSRYFVHEEGSAFPIVVEHATGLPRFTVGEGGQLHPYEPSPFGNMSAGVTVTNPPKFIGFPVHDRANPAFQPAAHAEALGAPSAYFTHWEADHPTFVRHADGVATHRVVDGRLVTL